VSRDRARPESRTFDEQIWPGRSIAQPRNLKPKSSLEERALQIEEALSFNDRARPNDVIADWQAFSDHAHAKLFQSLRHPGSKLAYVGCHDDHMD